MILLFSKIWILAAPVLSALIMLNPWLLLAYGSTLMFMKPYKRPHHSIQEQLIIAGALTSPSLPAIALIPGWAGPVLAITLWPALTMLVVETNGRQLRRLLPAPIDAIEDKLTTWLSLHAPDLTVWPATTNGGALSLYVNAQEKDKALQALMFLETINKNRCWPRSWLDNPYHGPETTTGAFIHAGINDPKGMPYQAKTLSAHQQIAARADPFYQTSDA